MTAKKSKSFLISSRRNKLNFNWRNITTIKQNEIRKNTPAGTMANAKLPSCNQHLFLIEEH